MARNYAANIDMRGLGRAKKALDALSPRSIARVQQRAIGTLRRRAGPEVARLMSEDLNLSRSAIRNRTRVESGSDFVSIVASNVGIPLSEFGATWGGQKTRGAVAQVFSGRAARTYPGTFIARVSGKQPAVYARAWRGGNVGGKRWGRFPVMQIRGPSIGGLLISTGPRQVAGPLLGFARDILAAEIERLVKVEMKG